MDDDFTPLPAEPQPTSSSSSGAGGGGGRDARRDSAGGRKRRREDDEDEGRSGRGGGTAQQQLQQHLSGIAVAGATPWGHARLDHFTALPSQSPMLQLHEEVLQFAAFVNPTPAEHAAADAAVQRVRDVVMDVFPACRMEIFGSRANGLVLPTSDWDILLFGVTGTSRNMHRLGAEIETRGLAAKLEIIDSARVPIVKLRDKISGISLDISFELQAASGLITRALINDYIIRYPAVRPLALVLKYMLVQRGLNETYSGGVGSFLLVLMVVHVVQMRLRDSPAPAASFSSSRSSSSSASGGSAAPRNDLNLGSLLMSFLELFGHNLNYVTTGISVRGEGGGGYYSKSKRGWLDLGRPFLLSAESPADPNVDVGRNSWGIVRVRRAFAHAHTQLSRTMRTLLGSSSSSSSSSRGAAGLGITAPTSMLAAVVRPDELLWMRARELWPTAGAVAAPQLGQRPVAAAAADPPPEASAEGAQAAAAVPSARSASSAAAGVSSKPAPSLGSPAPVAVVGHSLAAAQRAPVLPAAAAAAAAAGEGAEFSAPPLDEAALVLAAKSAALKSIASSGVTLRHPGRLADIFTRRERKVEEMAAANLGTWW